MTEDVGRMLPEYSLELIPKDKEAEKARVFSDGCWKELGKRFKIGGSPGFIQEENWPKCPCCNKKMTFYAQLDAIGEDYDIADAGLIYVFICFDFFEVKAILGSY